MTAAADKRMLQCAICGKMADGEAPKVLSGMRKIGGQKTRDAPFRAAETGDQREDGTHRAEKDQDLLGVYQKILHR